MKALFRAVTLSFVLAAVAGCASTEMSQQTQMSSERIARPNRILVYDFIASPADIPADSALRSSVAAPSAPPTPEELATGKRLGGLIAQELVSDIQAMGLSAVRAAPGSAPQVGDGVIRGYLVSVEGGSGVQRFVIGFGAGAAEMDTVVEGYVMTPQGLKRLGSGTLSASGSRTPGAVMPAAVAIGTGSPVGLIVVGGAKLYGEATGRSGLEGRAKATADEIAEQLKIRFEDRGWVR
jgi:Domain of unknown function (DUF4410)